MSALGTLRKQPREENLPALFFIARNLSLHSDVVSTLRSTADRLQSSLEGSTILIAYADSAEERLTVSTVAPETANEQFLRKDVRLGAFPGGKAVEREELAAYVTEAGGYCIEYPVRVRDRSIGAICALFESQPQETLHARASELLQWTSYLVGEAAALRISLAAMPRKMASEADAIDPRHARIAEAAFAKLGAGTAARLGGSSFFDMIGASDRIKEVQTLIRQVAGTEATVLLLGESGTGKELAAKAIHGLSGRRAGPFVAVNCAALPESVIESELFGHERGSFTGAVATRQGRFEAASGGTLFLDEIGDLSPAVQVKLLRILQEKTYERVGGNRSFRTDARIIVATHRDLELEVAEGRFREDLFFRLNVFPIHMPPLRERGADILLLADHFVEKFNASSGTEIKRISSPALDLLMLYHWPGNVRELENCISRAAIVSTDGVIHSYNLPPSLQSASSTGTEPTSTFDGALARLEKELLVEAIKIERGNSAAAAQRLGITERRFRFALRKYKLDYRAYRTKL